MGLWGPLFFSKEIARLEAYRDLLKSEEDKAIIDKAIEVLKKQEQDNK